MLRILCKSKIHQATITETHLEYEGSIGIDRRLMEEADIVVGERVQVVNLNNGSRLETYTIEEQEDSRTISLNGAAARLGEVGDRVIIISYALFSEDEARSVQPKIIRVDGSNRIKR